MSNNFLDHFFMTTARVAKYLVPPSLRPRLREEYSYFVRGVHDWRMKKKRDRCLKAGTPYLEWYASQCDDAAKNNLTNIKKIPVRLDWMKSGVLQLHAAIKAGLQPNNTFLEFGCGRLRAGNHFIHYLNDGNYSANDASYERIFYGKKDTADILGEAAFEQKKPNFLINYKIKWQVSFLSI